MLFTIVQMHNYITVAMCRHLSSHTTYRLLSGKHTHTSSLFKECITIPYIYIIVLCRILTSK